MSLDIHILGRGNYKPSLLDEELKLIEFEYRTRNEKTWVAGQKNILAILTKYLKPWIEET